MKKALPFIATALVSSLFTSWVFLQHLERTSMLGAEYEVVREDLVKANDRIDKLTFTKNGDFRLPDLTNTWKVGVSLGRRENLPVIDYR